MTEQAEGAFARSVRLTVEQDIERMKAILEYAINTGAPLNVKDLFAPMQEFVGKWEAAEKAKCSTP